MSASTFATDYYESIISEGQKIQPILCYTEKELAIAFDKIIQGLKNEEDWQVRIASLELLHAIAKGDGPQFDTFNQHLRMCHDLVRFKHLYSFTYPS
jgi:hypothetical protein